MKKIVTFLSILCLFGCGEKDKLNCDLIVIEEKLAYLDGTLYTGTCSKMINGKISEIQSYQEGERSGKWEKFYENGQLEFIGYCKKNEIHGSYQKYYSNGKLHIKGEFKEGYKTGRWVFLDENGNLINEEIYED